MIYWIFDGHANWQGATFDASRAQEWAEAIHGVVCEVPIWMDLRRA